ncbi:PAS domain-containing protein [Bdellovibrio sp. HCB2-146]|uniref:PAS domain-containing protein n=1 Tax=Bdellovibrio sp. HCB2-146 TaxID=3394362 RepID=UPI0039BCC180
MKTKNFMDQDKLLEKINRLIPNSVYIFDLVESQMVWFNERVQELYGYSVEELQALGAEYYAQTMHPDDVAVLAEAVTKARHISDGEIISLEYRFKDRLGNYHWIKDQITAFARGDDGLVRYVLGVATDVDDRKAYEETLKKTIDKLNLCLAAGKMGTWEWEIEKNVLHWDTRMYTIHGIPVDPRLSPAVEVNQRMIKEDLDIVNEKVSKAVAERSDFYVTYRVKFDNQEIHHVKCYGKFLSSQDDKKMYGVAWDSTEEILTEQEIQEARANMISAAKMAALGEMSAGIAHEINNPLTVIQARAFQLAQMADNNKLDTEKVKQAAESISRTADKIARIIRSLRSFAREGTFDPYEVVSVNQIVEETLEFCRTRFYNHGIEIELEPIPEDLEIECRLVQIEQVLLNLLNNSFDAIQQLEEKWIRVRVACQDNMIEIYVIDSGRGIPEDIQQKMMLPFFTTKEVGKGTGLGLSISSGIMRSHKGELFLDRQAANTTFVIRMPRWQADSAE